MHAQQDKSFDEIDGGGTGKAFPEQLYADLALVLGVHTPLQDTLKLNLAHDTSLTV